MSRNKDMPLLFELSRPGREGFQAITTPEGAAGGRDMLPLGLMRGQAPLLPEICEVDTIRHFTALSRRNFGLDDGFYPLGSCTMKHNPRIDELLARLPGLTDLHPFQPDSTVQGALCIMFELQAMLAEITGMDAFSLSPAAGAQGELAGLLMLKAYHRSRGESMRDCVIVPDSAHGTNPASAAMAGFNIIQVPSSSAGTIDIENLRDLVSGPWRGRIAGLMLTNPNTLGLFETQIERIADLVHGAGGLLYYDGANLNAIMGIVRPGDMGFDIVHLNLHKTFATPHGGGGPGAGPVGVRKGLSGFLPSPVVHRDADADGNGDYYRRVSPGPFSMGRVREFHGNFGVLVRAYCYILSMGGEGLVRASQIAVLNANYLKRIQDLFQVPFNRTCMHEFVLSGVRTASNDTPRQGSTLEIAKRLIDHGFHPPTVYFPLIVPEAIMIEPTETESPETLDAFADVLREIVRDMEAHPDSRWDAPHHAPIRRVDEVRAARVPVLRWTGTAPDAGTAGGPGAVVSSR